MSSPPAPGKIRLATASPSTQATTAATLGQLRQIAHRASHDYKADILLLPEAYLGGYPRGSAFGCVVGGRSAEGRNEFLKYFEQAVDLGDVVGDGAGAGKDWVNRRLGGGSCMVEEGVDSDGDGVGKWEARRGDGTREELERIAAETGVFLVTGLIEKAGGSLYCAAVYVCPKKGVIGKRRKVMPTGTERLIWAQGSPATLQAVSTVIRGVRVNMAAAICWESYMPLLRQALYAQNINLYLAPTADGRDAWSSLMRTIGIEGRCFVVGSNMCVRENDSSSTGAGAGAAADASAMLDEERPDAQPYDQDRPRPRRNSAITEDGFEIALPTHSAAGNRHRHQHQHQHQHQQRRRKSVVLDEDGNEIVLCCDEEVTGTATAKAKANGDQGSKTNGQGLFARSATSTGGKFISRGGSCITDPSGDVLAGPQWEDDAGLIYADVDFKDCIRGRLDLDAAGSYSRNDSFKFSVEGLNLIPLPY